MKKHIKNIVLLFGFTVATLSVAGLAVSPSATAVITNGGGGGGSGSASTVDCSGMTGGALEQCEEVKQRQANLQTETDLGRDDQKDRGPILTNFFNCNNNSSNVENQCIFVFAIAIFNLLAMGVGIAVVGGIIYGSIIYASSGGAPDRSKQGITIITNALIGLLAYFLMWSLINWLVPGGLFN